MLGKVVTAAGAPVEGAIVGVAGRPQSRVATDPDGTFRTGTLPPGSAELIVAAPSFETATTRAQIAAGRATDLTVTLTPRPPAAKLSGRVVDDTGRPVQATIRAQGPRSAETRTDESGAFTLAVPPGPYVVRVESDRYLAKETRATAAEGADSPVSFTVRPRPPIAAVAFSGGQLVVRRAVAWKGASGPAATELDPTTLLLLDEVVDVLSKNPDIRQVRVEAHWDSSVPRETAQKLTEQQARAVADYLSKQGVAADRLVVAGRGAAKPVVPNLGRAARSKNRRVEFHVVN